jgi:sec-independent protein translocase protein TatB
VFGFSFSEVVLIGVVTLVAVGPQRLPGMLRDFGKWMRKIRKMTTEVRAQTGIDEMLRAEGLHGGLNELRSLMRGGGGPLAGTAPPVTYRPPEDPYANIEIDASHEYPPEGPDAKGALPDDLLATEEPKPAATEEAKPATEEAKPVATEGAKPAVAAVAEEAKRTEAVTTEEANRSA